MSDRETVPDSALRELSDYYVGCRKCSAALPHLLRAVQIMNDIQDHGSLPPDYDRWTPLRDAVQKAVEALRADKGKP